MPQRAIPEITQPPILRLNSEELKKLEKETIVSHGSKLALLFTLCLSLFTNTKTQDSLLFPLCVGGLSAAGFLLARIFAQTRTLLRHTELGRIDSREQVKILRDHVRYFTFFSRMQMVKTGVGAALGNRIGHHFGGPLGGAVGSAIGTCVGAYLYR